jgi:hypothetical protein
VCAAVRVPPTTDQSYPPVQDQKHGAAWPSSSASHEIDAGQKYTHVIPAACWTHGVHAIVNMYMCMYSMYMCHVLCVSSTQAVSLGVVPREAGEAGGAGGPMY